jgi:hypothetical protein
MEYDFQTLFNDQLDKLDKKLTSFNKSIVKEYKIALNVINSKNEQENRNENFDKIQILLSDALCKSHGSYNKIFDNIEEILKRYL